MISLPGRRTRRKPQHTLNIAGTLARVMQWTGIQVCQQLPYRRRFTNINTAFCDIHIPGRKHWLTLISICGKILLLSLLREGPNEILKIFLRQNFYFYTFQPIMCWQPTDDDISGFWRAEVPPPSHRLWVFSRVQKNL